MPVTTKLPAKEIAARREAITVFKIRLRDAILLCYDAEIEAEEDGRLTDYIALRRRRHAMDDELDRLRQKEIAMPGKAEDIRLASDEIRAAAREMVTATAQFKSLAQSLKAAADVLGIAQRLISLL